ncbi:MAG: alpha-ketoglutarate-dependent dioxygenase AlkB [Halioglobus sp.]
MLFKQTEPADIALPQAEIQLWETPTLPDSAEALFTALHEQTQWQEEDIVVYGRRYKQPRLLAWHGDPGTTYVYSGVRHEPKPWTSLLLELRRTIEALVGHSFNSVLLNLYRDNQDSMGMHADDEPELGPEPVIASLSLGETRTFRLKHKRDRSIPLAKIPMPSGSLLVMSGATQQNWKHGIAKERATCGPRINLTFRKIY